MKEDEIDLEVEQSRIENREVNSFAAIQPPRSLRYYSQAQRRYLHQLEQGYYNAYACGLLFAPLLEQYSFLPVLKRVIEIPIYEGYSLEELCVTLFYFELFGFVLWRILKEYTEKNLGY